MAEPIAVVSILALLLVCSLGDRLGLFFWNINEIDFISPPTVIDNYSGLTFFPSVASTQNRSLCFWNRNRQVSYSIFDGEWTEEMTLYNATLQGGNYKPAVATNGNNIVVVWTVFESQPSLL